MNGCWRRLLGILCTTPLGARRSAFVVTTCSVLLRFCVLRTLPSFGGGIGRRFLDELLDRRESFSMGGGGVTVDGESNCEFSGSPGRSATDRTRSKSGPLLLSFLPLGFGGSLRRITGIPSSSTSSSAGVKRSRRLLAALCLLVTRPSASFSFLFFSLRKCFRSSFSISNAHQPDKASHRPARTFSMT